MAWEVSLHPEVEAWYLALCKSDPEAADLIEATTREAAASGLGQLVDLAAYASALLYNGLGRCDAVLDAARRVPSLVRRAALAALGA